MVRRHINRVKRTYTRARGILGGSNILQNPIIVGVITAATKNMINGQPPIDISSIQKRITQLNAKNPLIYLLLGHFLKNKPLMTVGAFLAIDPQCLKMSTICRMKKSKHFLKRLRMMKKKIKKYAYINKIKIK